MSNVIDFASASRASYVRTEPARQFEPRETGRQRASRKRNPLRKHCHSVDLAVTIAGRLLRGQPNPFDEVAYLQRGIDAARLLAEELQRILDRHDRGQR